MFKLAQLSDIHAGYSATRLLTSQGLNVREADGYLAFSKMVTEIIENEVDAVLVCGDTFHTPNPDIRTIVFVQNQFRRLYEAGIKVYILAGNHDANDIKADIAASRVLHDPWKKIYSHVEPYVHYEIADGINLHLISHHMFEDQSSTMSNVNPVDNEINILATHGSIFDKYFHEVLHAEKSPREIVIPEHLLDDYNWSYSLFGHIHERGWVGSSDKKTDTAGSKIYYNGSAIRRGFSDAEVPLGRGWTLWTIDDFGNFEATPKTVVQRPQYDFKQIDATGLSASEITDMVIENLKETQVNGLDFEVSSAPILRQKIINITPAKHSALDLKTISHNASHALSWTLATKTVAEIQAEQERLDKKINSDNSDVVKGYDEWVENSKSVQGVEELIKDKVVQNARDYVKLGQEEVLDAE